MIRPQPSSTLFPYTTLFRSLQSHKDQITSYVFDVVRAEVPKMIVDDVFEKKNSIAVAVKTELNDAMVDYGYDIIKTLVTDIDPDPEVKRAMNQINTAQREEVAAKHQEIGRASCRE